MAKRQKLSEIGTGLDNMIHIQNLLTSPEAKKMQKLDAEMSSILQNKNLPPDEKVRLYEETLGQYRQLQSAVVKQGGPTLLDQTRDPFNSKQVLDIIRAAVLETLAEQNKHDKPEQSLQLQTSTPKLSYSPFGKSEFDSNSSTLVLSDTKKKEAKPTGLTYDKLVDILKEGGMTQKNDKIHLPGESRRGYSQRTFDAAMKFLTSKSKEKIPHQTEGIVKSILKCFENDVADFDYLLDEYPNMNSMVKGQNVFDFDAWHTHDS